MNIHRRILKIAAVLSLICLFGCNDDQTLPPSDPEAKSIVISGEIDQVALTRVNDGGFCNGDMMGVYIVDYAGSTPGKLSVNNNRASNVRFTFDEGTYKWNSDYDIYWRDGLTHIDVYGYYPYGAPASIESYSFEVRKDQSSAAGNGVLGGYEASDFLWAKAADVAPTTGVVRLAFKHRMSNVRVTLVEGTGFTAGEWIGLDKQALVLNTKKSAAINLSDGSVTTVGEVSDVGIIPSKANGEFRAIVVPQMVEASKSLFNVTVGGVSYKFVKEEAFTYVSGKMHNFSIVVNKKANTGDYEFLLVSESITAWENDLVSHDATAKEYIVIDVPEAGTLKDCIAKAGKDYRKVQNLKITGKIDSRDFYFMRDEMIRLQSLNLKEVVIRGTIYGDVDNEIPTKAFNENKTITHLVLPDNIVSVGTSAFYDCTSLTGSLIIPEGVRILKHAAFANCTNMNGLLSLPTTLEMIEESCFSMCGFVCELKLPENLKSLGIRAFSYCKGLYGSLILPDGLETVDSYAFGSCESFSGSLSIPHGMNKIAVGSFHSTGFNGNLFLHDGITSIEQEAFRGSPLKGALNLPKNLLHIGGQAFYFCNFSGVLKLPETLNSIGSAAFRGNHRLKGTLEIPESVSSLGSYAFANCHNIEGLVLPNKIENIQKGAFDSCFGLCSIVCKANTPPYLMLGVFDGVPKDNFLLEVPEGSVQQYKTAIGWNEFKGITTHYELVCYPSAISALNSRCIHNLTINAEGDWEVTSKPSWCTLSAITGTAKSELTLTVDAMSHGSSTRTGEIVFKLKGKDYTTRCTINQYDYEYGEDQIITLQTASKGKGVNLVFIGDGFNAEDISTGKYMAAMREQVEHFFAIEPYATYRNYFNVYTAIALSPENGVGTVNTIRDTKFGTTFTNEKGLRCDNDAAFNYALRMSTVDKNNLPKSLVVLIPNTTDYEGSCQMWEDGSAIAICPMSTHGYPMDTRGIVQHEAGGHGFGKLGDECIYHNAFIDLCECGSYATLRKNQSLGWFQNLSLTGKIHEVPWAHLINHERYRNMVDIYEGGFLHSRGVFRSEQNSCMNNHISYFSTISREAIVKRILEYAGEAYTFEKFLANDKITAGGDTRSQPSPSLRSGLNGRLSHPQIYKGSPAARK